MTGGLVAATRGRRIIASLTLADLSVVVAQVLSALSTLLVVKLAALWLTVPEFGVYAIILGGATIIVIVAFGPQSQWAMRHYREAIEAGSLLRYGRLVGLGVLAAVAVVCTAAALAFAIDVPIAGSSSRSAVLGMTVLGLSTSAVETSTSVVTAARNRNLLLWSLVSASVLRVASVLGAVVLLGRSVSALDLAIASSVANAIVLISQVIYALSCGRAALLANVSARRYPASLTVRALVSYALPFAIWGIPASLLSGGERLVLARWAQPDAIGRYAAMSAVTMSVGWVASAVLGRTVAPVAFEVAGAAEDLTRVRRAHALVRRSSGVVLAGGVIYMAGCVMFPGTIVRIATSSALSQGAGLLWVLALTATLAVMTQQFSLHGLIEKSPRRYVLPKVGAPIAYLIVAAIIVPTEGLVGMVVAMLIAHACQLGLSIAVTDARWRSRTRLEGPGGTW